MDPGNHAVEDEIDRTLINYQGNVCIGTTLIHYEANGDVYEIPSGDCALMQQVMNNPGAYQNAPGVSYKNVCKIHYRVPWVVGQYMIGKEFNLVAQTIATDGS